MLQLHLCRVVVASFHVVTSSLKWTKLHSSYNLFLMLRIPYLGERRPGKVTKILDKQGSLNLIFASTDFRARKMVLHVHSCMQHDVSIK